MVGSSFAPLVLPLKAAIAVGINRKVPLMMTATAASAATTSGANTTSGLGSGLGKGLGSDLGSGFGSDDWSK